ncbi:NAD(P)-binding protein [Aspergillus eucalypticola CBS 122712]|uniref:NAD(P)-binding protein n=1 Tax=Aspergillus eucalypticola (strain CBS 122712 / IBT 29274) TaxID=1448314 RepID=A0A317VKW8_ASPEC|nr:NAD(P)-binding protein [Aspergillus eucalypticola CBS 122712]PWY72570.1 NAD(P)-binding protein [Aspergillus eucalypticola CBS 122712]
MALTTLDGVALVTGAGSGIGRQLCLAYAQAGCRAIALADINIEGVNETISLIQAQGYPVETLALETDVTLVTSVQSMVSETVKSFGRIDYGNAAANVAGITTTARVPTAQYPHQEYNKLLEINTKGTMICMQEQIKAMQKQSPTCTPGIDNPLRAQRGSIVNIASVTGFAALQNMMPYNVSKHAVIGLTKSAAVDHAPSDIRINSVCPGMTETPMVASGKVSVSPPTTRRGWAVEGNGRHRLAIPEEIADVCIFLSGCGASYMSGSPVTVDAGHLAALRYDGKLSHNL